MGAVAKRYHLLNKRNISAFGAVSLAIKSIFTLAAFIKGFIQRKLHKQWLKFAIAHLLLKKYGRPIIFYAALYVWFANRHSHVDWYYQISAKKSLPSLTLLARGMGRDYRNACLLLW